MRDRDKYGIARDKFVVLHVGHMNPGRNIAALEKLQDDHTQVMVVGSTSTAQDSRLIERLRDRGVIVWTGYVENIQEMYQLSDCYVFPTLNPTSCIEIPLSVLEAMACNLPVVSTKFGGLPDMFSASDGLYYVEVEELEEAVQTVKMGAAATNTRDKVINYSWENVCAALEGLYRELLEEI
jgi:glycosyltransferase involved in cell wall biosynthesis